MELFKKAILIAVMFLLVLIAIQLIMPMISWMIRITFTVVALAFITVMIFFIYGKFKRI